MKNIINNESIGSFLRRLQSAPSPILFLDYDGTLAPFVGKRDEAFPYDGVRKILRHISDHTRTRIIIVTGRPVRDLVPLLDLRRPFEIYGGHGWEHQKINGDGVAGFSEDVQLQEQAASGLAKARDWIAFENLQSASESKHASVTIHWRGLDNEDRQALHQKALNEWQPLADEEVLELHEFDGGLELRAVGRNKGDAIRDALSEYGNDSGCAVFLGDDRTDEDGFAVLNEHASETLRTLSVLVRGEVRETVAQTRIKPPDELLAFLRQWAESAS